MRLVTRYLLREHIGPLVFAVTTLTSLLLLNYIAKRFGDLVGRGLPWNVIGEFFVLSVPFTVALTLPMAVLIATLYAFTRLAADSEVTALMACGVGTRRLLGPVLGAGFALSVVMFVFNDQVLPRANQRLSSLQLAIAQKKPTLALKPQLLNEVSKSRLYMWMSHLDPATNAMRDVRIHDLNDVGVRRTIIADSGELAFAPNRRDLLLTLHHGYVLETKYSDPASVQRTFFRSNIVRVADVANELTTEREDAYKGEREMTVCEMQSHIALAQRKRDSTRLKLVQADSVAGRKYPPRYGSRLGEWYCGAVAALAARILPRAAHAQGTHGAPSSLPPQGIIRPPSSQQAPPNPAAQVTSLKVNLQDDELSINRYEVEVHKKFAISIACLIFALLGPPIALRFPRSGVGLVIGVSFSVFAVYYVALIAGEKFAKDLKMSPSLAMWAANIVLGTIAIAMSVRMGRYGSARGGDFGEFWNRILPWRRRRAAA